MANVNPLELVGQLPQMEQIQPIDNVSIWLQECGLSEYVHTFKSAGYDDINLIKILNDEDLDAMGIDKPGTRKKILMYAEQLKHISDAHFHQPSPIIENRITTPSSTPKAKGNSRANPYRCTKCCEYKIRSLDGKAHQCKPELIGHSWDMCPTQNIRQHPEERQRRKQDSKLNKNKSRKRKGISPSTKSESPSVHHNISISDGALPIHSSHEVLTPWEYSTAHYHHTQESPYIHHHDYSDAQLFTFNDSGPPLKRAKIDISQQVADVSAAVMENYISDEIAKQISSGNSEVDPRALSLQNQEISKLNFE